jgi:hypothetical protein
VRFGVAILSCALASCASTPTSNSGSFSAYAKASPLCDLISRPEGFVGNSVTVRGLYALEPHARVLLDTSCDGRLEVHLADLDSALRSDRKMIRLFHRTGGAGVQAVYSGALRASEIVAGCAETRCFAYTLVDAKLESVSAAPLSPNNSQERACDR